MLQPWSNLCLVCRKELARGQSLCEACLAWLPAPESACISCGLELSGFAAESLVCGQCQEKPPPFGQLTACCQWNEVVQLLVIKLKFRSELACADLFAELFARLMPPAGAGPTQSLVPVPLSRRRLLERGYNQAEELARGLAVRGLGALADVGARRRHTLAQSQLERARRRANIRGCFRVPRRRPGRPGRVIIVDDLVTTGNTAWEFAQTLRRSGYDVGAVWCLARVDSG